MYIRTINYNRGSFKLVIPSKYAHSMKLLNGDSVTIELLPDQAIKITKLQLPNSLIRRQSERSNL